MQAERASDVNLRIAQILREQHGVISRDQARLAGLSRSTIETHLRTGRWMSAHRGVYRDVAASATREQRLMAACLAGGLGITWVSGRSAARLYALDGCESSVVEVVTTGRWGGSGEVIVHRTRSMPTRDAGTLRGIPVTKPARTLLDLGAVCTPEEVEMALECALRRRLVTEDEIRWRLDRTGKGRHGSSTLRSLLRRRASRAPSESIIETRFLQRLRAADLPPPVSQFEIYDEGRFLMRVDLAYPVVRLAIELDGFADHGRRENWERDHRRRSVLPALGWRLIVVTKEQLDREADRVVNTVARAFRAPLA